MSDLKIEPGTVLLLIRHGETQWNADQRVQGHIDVGLSERGLAQARSLAAWMAAEPLDVMYSSDLSRAKVTADLLAAARLPVIQEPRFREADFGLFEGMTSEEIACTYPEAFHAWRTDAVRNRPPGGETLEDLAERCMAALQDHLPKHPGKTVAVVAHGGPIRAMLCGLLDLPLGIYPKLRVENTAVARVLFSERGPILTAINDTCHLRATTSMPEQAGWEER